MECLSLKLKVFCCVTLASVPTVLVDKALGAGRLQEYITIKIPDFILYPFNMNKSCNSITGADKKGCHLVKNFLHLKNIHREKFIVLSALADTFVLCYTPTLHASCMSFSIFFRNTQKINFCFILVTFQCNCSILQQISVFH